MFTITGTDLFLSRAEAAKRCEPPGGGHGGRDEARRFAGASSPLLSSRHVLRERRIDARIFS